MAFLRADTLLQGFPGRADIAGLSWASEALLRTDKYDI